MGPEVLRWHPVGFDGDWPGSRLQAGRATMVLVCHHLVLHCCPSFLVPYCEPSDSKINHANNNFLETKHLTENLHL